MLTDRAATLDFAKEAFFEANRGKNEALYLYLPKLLICAKGITEIIFYFVFSFMVKEGFKKERRPIASKELLYQLNSFFALWCYRYSATDSSVSENEAVYVRTVLNGKAENKLVEVIAIEHDHTEGIISATKSALSKVGISDDEMSLRIVGFCAHGANVNTGQRNGVVSLLSQEVPHLIDFHCMVHRLKLALWGQKQRTPKKE